MVQTMKKLKSGYINGTRVMLGNLGDFINTSAITDLSFLGSQEDGYPDSEFNFVFFNRILNTFYHQHLELNPAVQAYLDEHLLRSISHKNSLAGMRGASLRPRNLRRRMSVKGAIKKTRSINVDCEYIPYPIISSFLYRTERENINNIIPVISINISIQNQIFHLFISLFLSLPL